MLKYYEEEARELQDLGELPDSIRIAEGGFSYSDDEGEDAFAPATGEADEDDEEEKKEDLNVDNI